MALGPRQRGREDTDEAHFGLRAHHVRIVLVERVDHTRRIGKTCPVASLPLTRAADAVIGFEMMLYCMRCSEPAAMTVSLSEHPIASGRRISRRFANQGRDVALRAENVLKWRTIMGGSPLHGRTGLKVGGLDFDDDQSPEAASRVSMSRVTGRLD